MRADPDLAVLEPAAQAEPRLLDVTREQAIEVEHASHELADARQPEWLAGVALEPLDRRAVALGLCFEIAKRGDDVLRSITVRDELDEALDPVFGALEPLAPFGELWDRTYSMPSLF
jgi:hypothetical protein